MSKPFRTLDDADVSGKRVLLRVDLNVPIENGRSPTRRASSASPSTIREIADKGGKVILLAHFGRPKGGPNEAYSLKPVAAAVAEVVKRPVAFADDCIGAGRRRRGRRMKNGDILLLENTRFHKGEEKNDPALVEELAKLGDLYVNDAFSAAHRAHASTEGLAHKLPAYRRPRDAGGARGADDRARQRRSGRSRRSSAAPRSRPSSSCSAISSSKVDVLIIGGGMANTFLFAQGKAVGKSLCEKDLADTARAILARRPRPRTAASCCRSTRSSPRSSRRMRRRASSTSTMSPTTR